MYRIPDTHDDKHKYLDIPNVLDTERGFVYLDEYTQEPHMCVEYKDHYVDYHWSSGHYWVDAREISPAEYALKPRNLSESKQEMYFYLAEEFDKKCKEFDRMRS